MNKRLIKRALHNKAWQAIRAETGQEFSAKDIAQKIDRSRESVRSYLKSLVNAGYLEMAEMRHEKPRNGTIYYRLIRDIGIEPPVLCEQGLKNEAMWRTMRILPDFTWRELRLHASIPGRDIRPGTARVYVLTLAKAGYLIRLTEPKPGTATRYRLPGFKDSGPKPPAILRGGRVYDPNTDTLHAPLKTGGTA